MSEQKPPLWYELTANLIMVVLSMSLLLGIVLGSTAFLGLLVRVFKWGAGW